MLSWYLSRNAIPPKTAPRKTCQSSRLPTCCVRCPHSPNPNQLLFDSLAPYGLADLYPLETNLFYIGLHAVHLLYRWLLNNEVVWGM